jgi:hypothetical protein
MDWYYNEMTDEELLRDGFNQQLLNSYRDKCIEIWYARQEAKQEQTQL